MTTDTTNPRKHHHQCRDRAYALSRIVPGKANVRKTPGLKETEASSTAMAIAAK